MSISNSKAEKSAAGRSEAYEWLQSIVVAIIICVIIFTFFVRLVDVVGPSMNPTLENGDKMVVSGLFYKPKQGDIVIFRKDEYKPDALVKRVIATEGQTVEIDFNKGIVKVDGVALDEPYIAAPTINQLDFSGKQVVPEGCVFVMGDNRNDSTDSRKAEIGMVDERMIVGKVYFVIFPLDRIGSPYGNM
ncbi:MAG: signal peptidase I [Oscillospiraceae bacterium]|nr:signal peptidase I [Oscillospiraceae bacterium]